MGKIQLKKAYIEQNRKPCGDMTRHPLPVFKQMGEH